MIIVFFIFHYFVVSLFDLGCHRPGLVEAAAAEEKETEAGQWF